MRVLLLVVLLLAACSPTAETQAPSDPVREEAGEGPFVLMLELPKATWSAAEPITGTASLLVTGPNAMDISASGGGPIWFSYTEVAGTRDIGGVQTGDCAPYTIRPDAPITSGLKKSVGWSGDDPNAAFYEAFARGPDLHLPPGLWVITATASFTGPRCEGPQHELQTSIEIRVDP